MFRLKPQGIHLMPLKIMLRSGERIALSIACSLLFYSYCQASNSPIVEECLSTDGVFVESVRLESVQSEKAIQEGDLILSWRPESQTNNSIDETRRIFHSPIDFLDVLEEQSARPSLDLVIIRQGQQEVVRLKPATHSLDIRPNLATTQLQSYLAAREAISIGIFDEGLLIWEELADDSSRLGQHRLAAWHLLKIAESKASAAAKRSQGPEAYLIRAVSEAEADGEPFILARVSAIAAEIAKRASSYSLAEELLKFSLTSQSNVYGENVTSSTLLFNLGALYLDRRDLSKARQYYNKSLSIVSAIAPNSLVHAQILDELGGGILHREGNFAKSEELRTKALEIRQRLAPGSLPLAKSWINLASTTFQSGNLEKSESLSISSLAIQEQIAPQTLDRARSLLNLGNIYFRRGRLDDAQHLYSLSLRLAQEIAPDSLDVANCLDNLGTLAYTRDDFGTAEIYYQNALAIRQHLSSAELGIAGSLMSLGNLALMRGDLFSAESLYRRSLLIYEKESPKGDGHARALENMGMVAHRRGDMLSAEDFFTQSLKIRQNYAPNSLLVAHNLNNLGVVNDRLEDLAKSEFFHRQALNIREVLAPDSLDLADTLTNLGSLLRKKGRLTEAEELFKRSIRINQHHGSDLSTATCLLNLGITYLQLHRIEEAENAFQGNLDIHSRLTPGTPRETDALYRLGATKKALGKIKEAETLFERAFTLAEEQLSNLGGSQETRSSFTLLNLDLYRDYLDTLVLSGQSERAFLLSERYRGGIMLRLLAEKELFTKDALPQEVSKRQQEIDAEYDLLLEKLDYSHPRNTSSQVNETLTKLRRLREERAFLHEEIRRLSPRLVSSRYLKPLNLDEAQNALDPKTLLLSYSVGEDSTHLMLLTTTGEPFEIHSINITENDLRNKVVALRGLISNVQTESSFSSIRRKQLQAISESLFDVLISPAIRHIENSERLLIIPDGILHLLPWNALMVGPSNTYTGDRKYLVEWKPTHIALSVTLFAELSRTRHEKDFPTDTYSALAVFGDPHIPGSLTNKPEDVRETYSKSEPKDRSLHLEPLPATRIEAQTIASLFPEARLFLGKEATEERARALPQGTRIVHFATHGILDQRFPLNSSVVLSAQEQLENGEANGFLQAWEIFEHIRLDADLVVLSACESGLGKDMGGEGLIGLTRAFQYAGARSVLASLWKISDRTTAELMVRFYRHLKEGKPKDEALRAAQMELIRGPIQVTNEKGEIEEIDASAPYYWAAFQIYGDWQ